MAERQEIYFLLMRFFGWTLEQVMSHTPEELYFLCKRLVKEGQKDEQSGAGNLKFSTREEWQMWRELNGKP